MKELDVCRKIGVIMQTSPVDILTMAILDFEICFELYQGPQRSEGARTSKSGGMQRLRTAAN